MRTDEKAIPPVGGAVDIGDLPGAKWRKATRSGAENGGCVEIAGGLPGVAAIRDSQRPREGAHLISRGAFAAFLADVKAGVYDMESE